MCIVAGTTTLVQFLVVSLEKLRIVWWLIVCRRKKIGVDVVITGVHIMVRGMMTIRMPDQRPILLHVVLPFKPIDTMFMRTHGLVSAILLEMLDVNPDLQVPRLYGITTTIAIASLMSLLLWLLTVGLTLTTRVVGDLSPTAEIIVLVDIILMECSKMVDTVIPRMPVILSMWTKYQFHQLLISTSRVDIALLRAMNLTGLETITNVVVDGPLKPTKMLEDIIIHILQEISSQL